MVKDTTIEDILKKELPQMINDVTMLVQKPFRLIWDSSVGTASTDCLAEIRIAPRPFIEGEREVGYGTLYHETGHIRFSPYGMELMKSAGRKGGQLLQTMINIIVDRKDDSLMVDYAPGFADVLRKRLLVIRTLSRREKYTDKLSHLSLKQQSQMLRNFKPTDVFEDFFLVAKCGKSPRLKATRKALKFIRLKDLQQASPDELLWRAEQVVEALRFAQEELDKNGKSNSSESKEGNSNDSGGSSKSESDGSGDAEQQFNQMNIDFDNVVYGKVKDPDFGKIFQTLIRQRLGVSRMSGLERILQKLASTDRMHPGPISTGRTELVPVEKIDSDPMYSADYQNLLSEVEHLVQPMVRTLRNISNPSEFQLFGQEEGELDLTEVGRIATGLGGHYLETIVERDIDAEIHFAIDSSGSMFGGKVRDAKKLGIIFSEAMMLLDENCTGRIWSFNNESICDYGNVSKNSGFVTLEGNGWNSDTHMLSVVSKELLKSSHKRKILFVLCDDGPDDIKMVQRMSAELNARGIIVIHLLVGVHGSPDIYPIELLYSNMEECLDEFGKLLETVISNLK